MDLPVPIKRTMAIVGYVNKKSTNHLGILARRFSCLLSGMLIILPTLYDIVFIAETVSEKIRPMLALMCGISTFVYYSIMLWNRGSILELFAKLQVKVNERTATFQLQILIQLQINLFT